MQWENTSVTCFFLKYIFHSNSWMFSFRFHAHFSLLFFQSKTAGWWWSWFKIIWLSEVTDVHSAYQIWWRWFWRLHLKCFYRKVFGLVVFQFHTFLLCSFLNHLFKDAFFLNHFSSTCMKPSWMFNSAAPEYFLIQTVSTCN